MKICFCFLTYYGLERVDIWNNFFKDIDTNLYKVYIHPKYSNFSIDKYLFPINHRSGRLFFNKRRAGQGNSGRQKRGPRHR